MIVDASSPTAVLSASADGIYNFSSSGLTQTSDVSTVSVATDDNKGLSIFVILRTVCFLVTFTIGVVSNLLVLALTVQLRSRKQAVIQLLMASMAISDIGMLTMSTWLYGIATQLSNWTFATFLCKLQPFLLQVSGDSSMWAIAIVSIDRFLGLSRLGGSYFTLNNIVGLVAIIWITVCAINLPLFISTDAAIIMTPFQKVCLFSRHTNPRDAGIYELFSRVLVFVLPLAIIWGSHIGIYCKMRRGKKKVNAVGSNKCREWTQHQQQQLAKAARIGRMCVVLGSMFTIFWTPIQLFIALFSLGLTSDPATWIPTLIFFPVLNSCINPMIYGLMWKPLQHKFQQVIRRCSCQKKIAVTDAENMSTLPAAPGPTMSLE